MKEFDYCTSNEQVIFNQLLCGAQNQVECAFGRLKARWRILLRPMDIPIDHLPNIVYACFVLHNYCERQKTEVDANLVEQIMLDEWSEVLRMDKIHSYNTTLGRKVRDSISNYFKEYL